MIICSEKQLKGLLLRPGRGAEYCDQPVCLSVCLSACEHISGTAGPIRTKFCVQISGGRGSVFLRRRCATSYTSGCMHDVTCGRNGCAAGKGWRHSATAINYVRNRGGVWCLWMLVRNCSLYNTSSQSVNNCCMHKLLLPFSVHMFVILF